MILRAILLFLCLPLPVAALDLALPGGTLTGEAESPADTVPLPEAPWSADAPPPAREGAIRKRAYSVPGANRTTLQLIAPVRDYLEGAGYRSVFACADAECGGFDFRFQLDLLPEPDMHVDLGDFRYLLMTRDDAEPEWVALVASASLTAGFLHVTEVYPAVLPEPQEGPHESTAPLAPRPLPSDSLTNRLIEAGHVVLDDLDFGTGSADLDEGQYASLAELAAWLAKAPSARIVLVGHTDAVGSLEANVSLSRRRAASVADRLVTNYGIDRAQLDAAGAGYLAPRASNLTEAGRAVNRRVEVVLLAR
jgi:OOP family OmpA-OmpF porin